MYYLDQGRQAQVHRETYIAILNAAMRMVGEKRSLARQAGITPQYLSYILDPYDSRVPSPRTSEAIVNALPLPSEQRSELLQQMILARQRGAEAQHLLHEQLVESVPDVAIEHLKKVHASATHAQILSAANTQYRYVSRAATALLTEIDPGRHPLAYVEACFVLHDAQCVLNRPDSAIYYAKLARSILESQDPADYRNDRAHFDSLSLNAIRAEAVAYSNLRLYRQAYDCCLQAQASHVLRRQRAIWAPHVYRDTIGSLCRLPRFAISEVENLADRGRSACELSPGEHAALGALLLDHALGRAYLNHGNLKKADRAILRVFDELNRTPDAGALHRAIFLRTYARLRWAQGDRHQEWPHLVKLALETAHDAGLDHQVVQIVDDYRNTVASAQVLAMAAGSQ